MPWHLTASAQATMVSPYITELIPYDRLHAVSAAARALRRHSPLTQRVGVRGHPSSDWGSPRRSCSGCLRWLTGGMHVKSRRCTRWC